MSSILAYARLIHVFRPSHPLSLSPASLVLNGLDAVGGVSDAGDIASAGACYLLSSPFTANQPDSHIPAASSVTRDSTHHIGTQLSTENCTLRSPDSSAKTSSVNACALFLCPSLQALSCGRRPSILHILCLVCRFNLGLGVMAIHLFGGASAEQPAMFSSSRRHARRSSLPRFDDWHVARAVMQDRCHARFSSLQISYGLHQTTFQYLTLFPRTARCSACLFTSTARIVTHKQLPNSRPHGPLAL
ncbi:hypothetical protein FB45DRAFT_1039837 [Roridomyces roridus]|uniref:Uncharacterized protein n=1 Tax=Roridomyces roridus TaxID=1738132 RepID=A0AAD7B1U3_9AGAR|nr:hypothetical protein FB45DRAFT_1039837 [Roridomyces roridus]